MLASRPPCSRGQVMPTQRSRASVARQARAAAPRAPPRADARARRLELKEGDVFRESRSSSLREVVDRLCHAALSSGPDAESAGHPARSRAAPRLDRRARRVDLDGTTLSARRSRGSALARISTEPSGRFGPSLRCAGGSRLAASPRGRRRIARGRSPRGAPDRVRCAGGDGRKRSRSRPQPILLTFAACVVPCRSARSRTRTCCPFRRGSSRRPGIAGVVGLGSLVLDDEPKSLRVVEPLDPTDWHTTLP